MSSLSRFTVKTHPSKNRRKLFLLLTFLTFFVIVTASISKIVIFLLNLVLLLCLICGIFSKHRKLTIEYTQKNWLVYYSQHNVLKFDNMQILIDTGFFILLKFSSKYNEKRILIFTDQINTNALKILTMRSKLN